MARKQMTEAERERAAKRREEGLEQRHALFVEACEAMRTSEQWTRYLAFMARFHTYSPRNVMLILAQCEHATQVAGYERWRELGRQVRKGEAGLRILGGSRRMVKREDPVTGEIERVQICTEKKVCAHTSRACTQCVTLTESATEGITTPHHLPRS